MHESRLPKLSSPGLLVGALFFFAALAPSLIPRAGLLQGVLVGLAFTCGYWLGWMGSVLWKFLGLREMPAGWRSTADGLIGIASTILILVALWRAGAQQDAIHAVMQLPPVESARPMIIALTGFAVTFVLMLIARLFRLLGFALSQRLKVVLPERVALIAGFVATMFLFSFIGNDLLLSHLLNAFDAAHQSRDAALSDDLQAPTDPLKTGSTASLIAWKGIGAEGRERVLQELSAADISDIAKTPALEPLRIYVGLGSAETPAARAALALAEAVRIGAFERKTLVIATPTGTGKMDEAGMYPLEVLTRGDVATISVQYSYVPSWLSLLTVPQYGATTARQVFKAIYGHWRSLPKDKRPKLYSYGLSLGALNSDLSADFYDLVSDPYDGVFWVGPPFKTASWQHLTSDRLPESPAWLPRFRDGSAVRFLNQWDQPDADREWGRLRLVILQYASDPITFFEPSILWRRPEWMTAPRGPDVVSSFRWIPVVTFLQIGFDVLTSTKAPRGFGHVYAGRDYLRGWLMLLSPDGWDADGLARINAAMTKRGL